MNKIIEIDGSFGEGGGQILRSSLTLSMITGRAFRIKNIRAGRAKPGLMRQHLTCVKAAAEISGARVRGAEIGSQDVVFDPVAIKGGVYDFSIGTAGSTMLVLQTVLPALLMADSKSSVTLRGGTHNMNAPPYDFIEKAFLSALRQMGARVEVRLKTYGFHPAGGGEVCVEIEPLERFEKIVLTERKSESRVHAEVLISNLPDTIAKRELYKIGQIMGLGEDQLSIRHVKESISPGNVVFITVDCGGIPEILVNFGRFGVAAEKVAEQVCAKAGAFISSSAVVGEYLADQLILPMALAGAGRFKTMPLSLHSKTNINIIQKFLSCDIDVERLNDTSCFISFTGGRSLILMSKHYSRFTY